MGAPLVSSIGESDWSAEVLTQLTGSHQQLLAALIPAFTGHHQLPTAVIITTIQDINQTIALLPQVQQQELLELFDLLTLRYTRWFTTGFWRQMNLQGFDQIGSEFQAWRSSGIQLYRQGAAGLHELICGAFYANPDNWKLASYQGPPL